MSEIYPNQAFFMFNIVHNFSVPDCFTFIYKFNYASDEFMVEVFIVLLKS